jgi:serine protease inhibitor
VSVEASNVLTARWAACLDGASTVLSGASVHPLLALLAQAAHGPARDELTAVASQGGAQGGDLAAVLAGSPTTQMALGVWSKADVPLTDWWISVVHEALRGTLTGDRASDQAALDAWAAEQTGGLIPTMPVSVNSDTLMVLASALAVTTTWVHSFTDRPIRPTNGPWAGRAVAGLMRTTAGLAPLAVTTTAAGALTLLTVRGDQDVDVVLALGEPDRAAAEVVPAALAALGTTGGTPTDGPGVTSHTIDADDDTPELFVETVRFGVRADHDLLAHADVFGLRTASDTSRGHFPGISDTPLAVDQARQAAMATFTSDGFKAAAITALAMAAGAMPAHGHRSRKLRVQVTFDRPFGFLAVHRPTGLILVAGWVADPEEASDAYPLAGALPR